MNDNILNIEFENLKKKLIKSGIDISDTTIDNIISNFEGSLSKEYKKKHGIVYTPQWVADGMCDIAINKWLYQNTGIDINIESDKDKLNIALDKIKSIKICDPCVGSGVYIFSIIKTLENIYRIIYNKLNTEYNKLSTLNSIINNNIYCIDIDSNAVLISRFRLWAFLRLNNYEEDFENFEYNVYIGDSINTLYEGLNIEYDRDLTQIDDINSEYKNIYIDEWQSLWDKYIELKTQGAYTREIYKIQSELYNKALEISSAITGIPVPFKLDWKIMKNRRIKIFNWYLEFEDIFKENNGFDIIISNPPYVRNSDIQINETDSMDKSADLYIYFLELWKKYGNENCISTMITPNNWFSAAYADKFRHDNIKYIDTIIDFNMHYVFEGVYTATAISLMTHNVKDDISYANVEYIMNDNQTDNFVQYTKDRLIKSQRNKIDAGKKFIFADDKLYNILDKLNQLPTLESAYNIKAYKGKVISDSDRINTTGNTDGPYLAMGKDTNQFTTLTKTDMICNKDIENTFDNCIIIPEVTRRIRACRIQNIIPLDSLLVIECSNKNILALINSEIFDLLYNIMISTNYCISYAEVRFPRKNKQIGMVPVPPNIDKLDSIRIKTNEYNTVSNTDINEINKIVQELYNISNDELEVLRKYNI